MGSIAGRSCVEDVPDVGSMVASVSAFADADRLDEAGQERFAMAESRLTPDLI